MGKQCEGSSLDQHKYILPLARSPLIFNQPVSINKASTSKISPTTNNMKPQVAFALLAPVVGAQSVLVEWFGCSGAREFTDARDEGCTNVSGWKTDNLCGVDIASPKGHCDFYTTACFSSGGSTFTCSYRDGKCEARNWPAIRAYRCFFD